MKRIEGIKMLAKEARDIFVPDRTCLLCYDSVPKGKLLCDRCQKEYDAQNKDKP